MTPGTLIGLAKFDNYESTSHAEKRIPDLPMMHRGGIIFCQFFGKRQVCLLAEGEEGRKLAGGVTSNGEINSDDDDDDDKRGKRDDRTYRPLLRLHDQMIILERERDDVAVCIFARVIAGTGVLDGGRGRGRGNVHVLHHLGLAHVSGYI